jgi:hypothetical protein
MTNTTPKGDTLETLESKVSLEENVAPTIPKKRGRPRKADLAKQQNKGKVGRPKGDAAIINEYKARMLNSPKSAKVLESIFDAALNDDHKFQSAAWKLVVDRIMPVAAFEKDVVKGAGNNAIQINITGVTAVESNERVIDGGT